LEVAEMTEICDPLAGYFGIGYVWAFCRGGEEACIEVQLIGLSAENALVRVIPSFGSERVEEIPKGSYKEYSENGITWRVYCDGINFGMAKLANIRICYDTEVEEGMAVGDSRTVDGTTFTLTKIICEPVQEITARVEGVSKIIALGAIATFPTGLYLGGLFIALKAVNAACDRAIIEASGGGLTPEDVTEIDTLLEADYTRPDGTKPTPEEIHDVKMRVIDGFDYTDPEFVAKVEELLEGTISKDEFETWLKQYTLDKTEVELDTVYYSTNFSLDIPTFVMAGEVHVTGIAPQANQDLQIMGVKKLFGFDWLATDTELATVTAGADNKYEAILTLDEFGIIEVYGKIPKEWWEVLDKDVTTTRHTVFVLTWMMLIALIIIAALVYNKTSGGKLKRMLKR
jgi:hypothetical protein